MFLFEHSLQKAMKNGKAENPFTAAPEPRQKTDEHLGMRESNSRDGEMEKEKLYNGDFKNATYP